MKKANKRFLALLLSLIMALGCVTTAFATEPEEGAGEVTLTTTEWEAKDFTYGYLKDPEAEPKLFQLYPAGEADKPIQFNPWVVTGFSETGAEKIKVNTELVIPPTDPDGNKVQGVGKDAFNNAGITKLTLPENIMAPFDENTWTSFGAGVKERGDFVIGYQAFRNNNLKKLELPEGVVAIENYAFANNTNLTAVTFPKTIMYIGSGVVYKTAVSALKFPEKVDLALQIDSQTFSGAMLKIVQLPSNIDKFSKLGFAANKVDGKAVVVDVYINTNELGTFVETPNAKSHKIILGTIPWVAEDFTYDEAGTTVLGFSDSGKEKVGTAHSVAVPEVGPTGEAIVAVGDGVKYPANIDLADQYYNDAVAWSYLNDVTTGTTATEFGPEGDCTRAQVVTFLWRVFGSPEPTITENPFTDVAEDQYYYKAVLWAVEKGITNGKTPTTFDPEGLVTRAEFVTFLYRANGSQNVLGENPFTDVANGQYYKDSVLWAAQKGITTGTSATTFSPDDSCIRCQVVTFLYRAYGK